MSLDFGLNMSWQTLKVTNTRRIWVFQLDRQMNSKTILLSFRNWPHGQFNKQPMENLARRQVKDFLKTRTSMVPKTNGRKITDKRDYSANNWLNIVERTNSIVNTPLRVCRLLKRRIEKTGYFVQVCIGLEFWAKDGQKLRFANKTSFVSLAHSKCSFVKGCYALEIICAMLESRIIFFSILRWHNAVSVRKREKKN